jgi:hypothetical protein
VRSGGLQFEASLGKKKKKKKVPVTLSQWKKARCGGIYLLSQ